MVMGILAFDIQMFNAIVNHRQETYLPIIGIFLMTNNWMKTQRQYEYKQLIPSNVLFFWYAQLLSVAYAISY